jgi:hypothetical protein
MHKHIFAAIIADNKSETFLRIEKLYDTLAFAHNLCGHRRTAWSPAASAETATTAAAAEAITAAATETVSTATEAITAATATETVSTAAAVAAFVTETVALISAASATITAATFIETHALSNFPSCFARIAQKTKRAGRRAQGLWRKIIRRQ